MMRDKRRLQIATSAGRLAAGHQDGYVLYPAVLCAVLGLLLTSGCGRHKSDKAKETLADQLSAYGGPETARLRVGKPGETKKPDLPGSVRGTGWHIPWYAPDPRHPDGPRQRLLVADAQQGAMEGEAEANNNGKSDGKKTGKNNVLTIHLSDVTATLYHDGKPSATLTAPRVTTNERDQIIVATGGVTIHSLIDPTSLDKTQSKPADTTVIADKVVWDAHKTEIVCTGNATLIYKQPGVPDSTLRAPLILYNTETHHFTAKYRLP